MCYKHGGPTNVTSAGAQKQQLQQATVKRPLFLSSYFDRLASQKDCYHCQERVSPEEVKSALGVCTVYLMRKTVEWMTNKEPLY